MLKRHSVVALIGLGLFSVLRVFGRDFITVGPRTLSHEIPYIVKLLGHLPDREIDVAEPVARAVKHVYYDPHIANMAERSRQIIRDANESNENEALKLAGELSTEAGCEMLKEELD